MSDRVHRTACYGVLTTPGRKTGRPPPMRPGDKHGDRAYLVALRLPHIAVANPTATQAWVHNIRANPSVRLRIRGGDFDGTFVACRRGRKSKICTATGSKPEFRSRST